MGKKVGTSSGIVLSLVAAMSAPGAANGQAIQTRPDAPVANVVPESLVTHGHTRIDDYLWLRERENPEVISYLEAENAYTESVMAPTVELEEVLFQEIRGRIKEDDSSVPVKDGAHWYYTRFEEGREYPIYVRKKGSLDASEEVMLDVNELARDRDGYYQAGGTQVSFEENLLAFSVDTVGRRIRTVRFRDLDTGEFLPDVIPDVTGNLAWANDNRTVFYSKQDPNTLRSYQIYRHVLGTDPADDALIYQEDDEEFSTFVTKTKSDRYIMVVSSQTVSNEYRYLDAADPMGDVQMLFPRERNHEYTVEHYGDHFYFVTNDQATNFRLVRAPVKSPDRENWEEVVAHREDVLLQGIEIFRDHLVVLERAGGLVNLRVIPWSGAGEHYIDFGEPAYTAFISANPDFESDVVRFGYQSMTTPNSVFEYDMESRERTLLKQTEVLGGFQSSDYTTERRYATARDGERVPVSIVYRNGVQMNGEAPLLLDGYGSYGASRNASFNSARLSLLDRGFVYAIAHIRGGQEMGRRWYDDGKLFNKMNTFTDFIDVAEYLVAEGYADPDRLFAQGGSAGGLLMGAVVNLRPDLWRGVVARVPFVDVVTTMLDETIPLTTFEYDEWGDPNEKEYYDYMLSYSPYDQVAAKDYPNILVTTGLHDSQVQYWEPAKWVAKLRAMKTDDNILLLETNMEAGHGGSAGRFQRLRETAFIYAFMVSLTGTDERISFEDDY